MANLNRDYLVTLDVKTSDITLSSPMTFYVTDRRTMNIFVKLVMNMSDNPVIKNYVALENAMGYRTELVLVAPNNQPFYLEGELLNGDEALFCFNLDTEQISKIGDWVCELRVYSVVEEEEEIVTSKSFLYSVNESITTSLDDVALDDTTYGIIDELIGRIGALEDASPGGENDIRLTVLEATKYDDVQVQKTEGKLTLTFFAKKTKMKTVEIPASEDLEQRVTDCEESIAWLLENGGGGGGVTSAYLSTTDSENFILTGGTDLELHLDFYSPNIGRGTLKVTVDDVDIMSSTLSQGESTVVITGDLLHKGVNVVKVYAVDRVGVMTNTLVFNVRYGSTELTTTFDPYQIYDAGAVVRYYFTAVALNTADKLTFYMSIDGQTQTPVDCTSDVRAYFTFPILSIGSHYCEAWVEDSYGKSNTIAFNFVVLDDSSLTINSTTRTASVEEGAQLILDYRVYMRNNSKFITETYIDNVLINTGECNADTNYYTTSSLKEGQHTIKIVAYNIDKTVSDYVNWVVNITPSTYEMKQPVTAGAIAMFTAKDRTNSDQDRDTWTGRDQDGTAVVANLSGFSYDADNGWNNNELIISGKSTVEIPIAPLANNARYGFSLDIEFTSKQIGVEDAEVLSLWNETDNCGIRITTERLILRSKAGNECNLFFSDNENVSAMFVIDRDEKVAKIYLNGVMCEAFSLSDYVVGGQAVLEDFTVDSNIILGGGADKNGYCKIRNLRVYEVALATNEILNNWLSNITDKTAQRDMEKFQNGDDLPTLTVYCDFAGLGKDDKKPCDIVYYSPDVTKYGESFTLSGKTSQLQYQGTSSMQYPIKNYRLNLRDVSGEKWYYNPYQGGQPECRFTLKADFMSSGHWQNTGLAKFVSDKLYGYKTNDLSTMNPAKRYDIQNGGTLKDTRDSINGFPCRLILVNDGSTPLNEGQNEPTPGNTKDMGIFNFNNDKDNVSSLGLDTEIFPNALSYEVTANSDTSAGAFVPCEKDILDYTTADGMDSCSVLLPANFVEGDAIHFSYTNKIMAYDENKNYLYTTTSGNTTVYKPTTGYFRIAWFSSDISFGASKSEMKAYSRGNKVSTSVVGARTEESKELEYLQQSFELRYPDEDDVGKDYGYLGMEAELPCIDMKGDQLNTISLDYFGTKTLTITHSGTNAFHITTYDNNKSTIETIFNIKQGSTVTLEDEVAYVKIYGVGSEYIIINDVKYSLNVLKSGSITFKDPYIETTFSQDYGLKRVIEWVGNCTDEQFVADYEKYFDKHYLLRYYLLVITLGMVDNLGKNMMLDTWDGQIWYPRFYDMDTICSYDNSGAIKFDVDIEMEQGYWNTSSSRLWTKVRDLLHDELVVAYKDMRASGLSYDGLMNYFYGEQIAKIPQKYYNMDADVKYLPYADEYLGKAHGNGYEHLKRWLKNRLIFTDTLFDYGPSYESDMLTIRANTLEPITFEIETYTPVYQHVSYYNGQMSKLKIDGKTATTFTGNAQTATDQEILIYGGSNIKRIRGISSANPDSMLIGNATKLAELDISNCPILIDVNSNKANFAPHQYLNKLNIENCPQLGGTLELTYSPLIQEIKAKGTSVTGLRLPTSVKNLETLELPNTISSLALYDATSLETLKFDEGVAMQSIELSNCTGITNTENFDLTKTPTVILDNSYNTDELYMSETTNLTLRNMSNLERVIYTPNSEYSEFDINNVINGSNYKVTTSSCPKLSTFITTAPHRHSYNNDDVEVGEITVPKVVKDFTVLAENFNPQNTTFEYTLDGFTFEDGNFIEAEVNLNDCTNSAYENILGVGEDIATWSAKNTLQVAYNPSSNNMQLHAYVNGTDKTINIVVTGTVNLKFNKEGIYLNDELKLSVDMSNATVIKVGSTEGSTRSTATYNYIKYYGEKVIYETRPTKIYGDITPNTAFTANTLDLSATQFEDIKLLCTTDVYNLKVPTTMKNFYCDSAMDIDTDVIEDGGYEVIHEELIESYTTNYEGEVYKHITQTKVTESWTDDPFWIDGWVYWYNWNSETTSSQGAYSDYIRVSPGSTISITSSETSRPVSYVFFDEHKQWFSGKGIGSSTHTETAVVPDGAYYVRFEVIYKNHAQYTMTWEELETPNIIPSSANGSLIFNMYSNNTTQPTSTSPYMWDLTGLKLEDFYTYGMNNWVKPSDDSYVHEIQTDKVLFIPDGNYWYGEFCRGFSASGARLSPIKFSGGDSISVHSDGNLIVQYSANGTSAWYQQKDAGATYNYAIDGENSYLAIYVGNLNTTSYIDITHKGITHRLWVDKVKGRGTFTGSVTTAELALQLRDQFMVNFEDITTLTPKYIGSPTSITMPQRMPGYSVRLVNADITPNKYPTMLYPKWIDTGLPITGKLDYTKYNGTSLAWAYAYTTGDVDIKPLGSESQGNITQDYNKLYGTDFVDIRDVWVYKDTDTSKLSTNEAITKAYIELTSDNYESRIDEVLQWYPNCTDLYLFDDGSVTTLEYMLDTNNETYKSQITNVAFLDGYFDNLTSMYSTFQGCTALIQAPAIPDGVTNVSYAFYECTSLTQAPNIPSSVTSMSYMFQGCTALTTAPNISGSGGAIVMDSAFQGCTALTTAPAIPDGVVTLYQTFHSCTSLTQAPAIPDGVTKMYNTFRGCTSLTQAPTIPSSVTDMKYAFAYCENLTSVNIPSSVQSMEHTFRSCSKLQNITIDSTLDDLKKITQLYRDCSVIETVYIPLKSVTGSFSDVLTGTDALKDVVWLGERSSDFNVSLLKGNIPQTDIQELVSEHLADLTALGTTATLTLGSTYLAYLTEEEIAGAVAKGWTLQ